MKSLATIILIFLLFGFEKKQSNKPVLNIIIESKGLRRDSTHSELDLKVTVINSSSFNLILYNIFGKPVRPLFQEDSVCDDVMTAKTILIFDSKNSLVMPRAFRIVSDSVDYTAMPFDRVQKIFDRVKNEFTNSTTIIRPNQHLTFIEMLDLSSYEINNSEYYLELMYSSGSSIDHSIDEGARRSLKKSKNTREYRGCLRSNRIKVILR